MKAVERKLNKAQLATIWLLVIALVLAAAYVALIAVINKLAKDNSQTSGGLSADDLIEGEGIYSNQLVAYPSIEESQITNIEVSGPENRFGISRYPDDLGVFRFHYYLNGKENSPVYYTPPILAADGAYKYSSLYSVENSDGNNMIPVPYLTYLCVALSVPYFSERIELPSKDTEEGAAKRNELLKEYGLTQSESTIVAFMYGERDEETGHIPDENRKVHTVTIGKKALSGNGFYFMVDGRNYVYYTKNEYFSYALKGLNSFVKGMLVSEGIGQDAVHAPHLTTDFKEWKTTVFKNGPVFLSSDVGYGMFDDPTVVVKGNTVISVDKGLDPTGSVEGFSGYEITEDTVFSFDLDALKDHPDGAEYEKIIKALKGKEIGPQAEKILLTLLTNLENQGQKQIVFGDNDSLEYTYSVSKIESEIVDGSEINSGAVSASNAVLKVTYRYTVGGVTVGHDCHSIIDLSVLSAESAQKFVGARIGEELDSPIVFTVEYNKSNALSSTEKYVIKTIDAIFDENGEVTNTVTEKSSISITYYTVVNGKVGDAAKDIIILSAISDTSKLAPLKTELLGKGRGTVDLTVYEDIFYYEYAREFVTYEISEIKYLVANEIIVSFEFRNASERDPYYGNTYFANTLENEYSLYGLNPGTCETAVRLLGGINNDGSSAEGLFGETVAVGLNLESMYNYDLYAHKIYFELPRGIFDPTASKEEAEDSDLNDFMWLTEIGFTLYISGSKFDEDGSRIRYIGSDMYDVIVKVDAEKFDFVEYGFVEFWARRDIVAMDIADVESISLEFNMDDLKGTYSFNVMFEEMYGGYVDGKFVSREEQFTGSSKYTRERIMVKASDDAFDTAFKDMFGTKWGDLASLYNNTMGDGETTLYPGSKQTLGASYFNSVYHILMLTTYLDCLDEDEQAAAFEKTKIMSMDLGVVGKEYNYTYDFYRLDDRRIMVSLYRTDPATGEKVERLGEVSDFYISTFAFKKLVNCYIHLLEGMKVDENISYPV